MTQKEGKTWAELSRLSWDWGKWMGIVLAWILTLSEGVDDGDCFCDERIQFFYAMIGIYKVH